MAAVGDWLAASLPCRIELPQGTELSLDNDIKKGLKYYLAPSLN